MSAETIARSLREMAAALEAGEYSTAKNLVWVIDCGDGTIECGIVGETVSCGAEAHFLLSLGERKLQNIALGL